MSKLTQYGHAFQIKALAILITDRDFLQQIADIVSPDYFDNDAGKWIMKKTLQYFNEYKTVPTMEVFKVEVEGINQELQSVAVKDLLKQAYKESKATDLNFVKDTFLDFCKNQTLKGALIKSVDLLELGDYDDIRTLIDRALKAGTERDIGHEYIPQLEDRFREEARSTVETPWPLINKLLCGGLGQGDLGMIAGGPGGGKSWALVAMGAQAVKTGHTVIHYTLELSEKYVGKRYDACLTEIPVGDVHLYKEKVKEKIENLRGGLYIREYPAGQATVNTIHSHLEKCIQQGIKPDLVIIDYADLLTSKASKEKRDKLDDIYTNLRGLATEMKLPIWTASQVNRSGAREDIIQGDRMAESYTKMMVTDFAMSLSRSAEDKENGVGRWHIMKNRYGADGITYDSIIDTSIGKISINMRGNNRNTQTPPGEISPAERRRLRGASNEFFGV
ncbi:MAG: AAA family ATPase [Pelagibacterales bacterium]|nr:AAA family ATPase [Pelagibacterales bacterium]